MKKGAVIIVSGPSASGKTTVAEKVISGMPGVARMITTTSRPPRPGEIGGRDYFFVSREEFEARRDAGDLIEWAENYGNYYGGSRAVIDGLRAKNDALLLIIDIKGVRFYRQALPGVVTVFIAPSSVEELRGRFEKRPGSTPETTARRLVEAEKEMAEAPSFDHVIVNRDGGLDEAVAELKKVVEEATKT